MIDMGGKTTDACIYAAIWRQAYGLWPSPFPMPLPPQLNPSVLGGMGCLATAAGRAQALYEDASGHDRTTWFADGLGRGLVGLTETMNGWTPGELAKLRFVPLPTAVSATSGPPTMSCFADAVGIRPGLGANRAVAVSLCNLIASTNVLVAAMYPTATGAQRSTSCRRARACSTNSPRHRRMPRSQRCSKHTRNLLCVRARVRARGSRRLAPPSSSRSSQGRPPRSRSRSPLQCSAVQTGTRRRQASGDASVAGSQRTRRPG